MSYKEEFASNNTDLQTILDKVNALPDAGGALETSEVTIAINGADVLLLYTTLENGVATPKSSPLAGAGTTAGTAATVAVSIVKGTSFFVNHPTSGVIYDGETTSAGITSSYDYLTGTTFFVLSSSASDAESVSIDYD